MCNLPSGYFVFVVRKIAGGFTTGKLYMYVYIFYYIRSWVHSLMTYSIYSIEWNNIASLLSSSDEQDHASLYRKRLEESRM